MPTIEPGEFTLHEAAERFGCDRDHARKVIDALLEAGTITRRENVRVPGRQRKCNVYRMVEK